MYNNNPIEYYTPNVNLTKSTLGAIGESLKRLLRCNGAEKFEALGSRFKDQGFLIKTMVITVKLLATRGHLFVAFIVQLESNIQVLD